MIRKQLKPRHLGDGVYIHDEGHGISLAVNHHENKVIHMGSSEILKLIEFAKETKLI